MLSLAPCKIKLQDLGPGIGAEEPKPSWGVQKKSFNSFAFLASAAFPRNGALLLL